MGIITHIVFNHGSMAPQPAMESTMHHDVCVMLEDELEDTSWSSNTSFVSEDELEMSFESFKLLQR